MQKNVTLDRFDHALLDLVQRNNLTPARILAEKVGLSDSAVLRRLQRLRASASSPRMLRWSTKWRWA